MKNGLFLVKDGIHDKNTMFPGVSKKVISQIDALNIEKKLSCKHLVLPKPEGRNPILNMILILFGDVYKKIYFDACHYDFVYIRLVLPASRSFMKLLKVIKKNNQKIKIIYEIPTYPYDKELKNNLRERVKLFIDKIYRLGFKKYVDKIATVSKHDVIFGIPTIKFVNGISCADIQVRITRIQEQNTINLIAVATFAKWHGYDRLIEGLKNYYTLGLATKVYIHFVGNGQELDQYKEIVKKYNLSEKVFFHGPLFGNELTNVFNMCDIGVCTLGFHRKGISLSSELKSREYLARGMPIISSAKIDVLPPDFKYCLYVPEDESPIDIQAVVHFYNNLVAENNVSKVTSEIRNFAEKYCEMSFTMKPIVDYICDDASDKTLCLKISKNNKRA